MSDSTQQYILKQPITIKDGEVWKERVYELPFSQWGTKNGHSCVTGETLEEFFQSLDIPAIEKQLDDIITDIGSHYWNNDQVFMEDREQFAKEIKVLFGLENTGGTIDAKALYLEGEKGQTNPGETNERS